MLSTLVLVGLVGLAFAADTVHQNSDCKEQAEFVARSLASFDVRAMKYEVLPVKNIFYCAYNADADHWVVYVDVEKDSYQSTYRKCYTQVKKGPNGWQYVYSSYDPHTQCQMF